MENVSPDLGLVWKAIAFATKAHLGHFRKDRETPYCSHLFRVGLIVNLVFQVNDPPVLCAALLHDTIEDTRVDFDDLEEEFGPEISHWVSLLTKDKRLDFENREIAYGKALASSPWQVQIIKLADIYDNLQDSWALSPQGQAQAIKTKGAYLEALRSGLKPQATAAWEITSRFFQGLKPKSE